jgi:hypothetical protein
VPRTMTTESGPAASRLSSNVVSLPFGRLWRSPMPSSTLGSAYRLGGL